MRLHIWDEQNRNRGWLILVVALSAGLIGLHAWLSRDEPGPLGGASTLGLWLGVAGSALMLWVGLIFVALRERDRRLETSLPKTLGYSIAYVLTWPVLVTLWPLTRNQPRAWWLRAHVWMGLFSLVIILCHSGYRWGGWLTASLWLLVGTLVVSGSFGLVMQQFLPRLMRERFPNEAPYGQIPHLRELAAARATELFQAVAGAAKGQEFDQLKQQVAGFLRDDAGARRTFSRSQAIVNYFENLRARAGWSKPVDQELRGLEDLCREVHALNRQESAYWWLHSWLAVHVALAVALLVLVVVHGVVALSY
jgi:hypothetical protein